MVAGKAVSMRGYILFVLGLVSFLNFVDRQILTILLEAVKKDLQVSDTAMGLLSGTAFAIVYATASMPIARWADRGPRRTILAAAVAVWSLATGACGLASHWLGLAAGRMTVAASESAAVPISHSLLADLYPPRRRATTFGILMAAGSVGIAAGLFAGGWANVVFGWRGAFMLVGLPGVVVALLMWLTVPEPVRLDHAAEGGASGTTGALLANPLYRSLLALAALGSTITYATLGWAPTFMIRLHGLDTAQVGLGMGLATGLGNALGHTAAGWLSDRLATRDVRWYAGVPALATFGTFPLGVVFLRSPDATTAMIAFGFMIFFMAAWLQPIYALAYRVAGTKARAQASAMIAAIMSLVGLGVGPLLVGRLNDYFKAAFGTAAIRESLTIVLMLNVPLIIGFILVLGQVRRLGNAASPERTGDRGAAADAIAAL